MDDGLFCWVDALASKSFMMHQDHSN